ncbi:hypothetical protein RCL_jg6519.t1 [Rhizophagus clarus]|uniref:Uncharacterized protein n=1 Tax=Rhizophagus clarus TaxID=94130 RepID=A0A8H3QQP2_9GLOM|nr:hypothetical protein RCL_jg6519.t1 [Rhizophagus clarus]
MICNNYPLLTVILDVMLQTYNLILSYNILITARDIFGSDAVRISEDVINYAKLIDTILVKKVTKIRDRYVSNASICLEFEAIDFNLEYETISDAFQWDDRKKR